MPPLRRAAYAAMAEPAAETSDPAMANGLHVAANRVYEGAMGERMLLGERALEAVVIQWAGSSLVCLAVIEEVDEPPARPPAQSLARRPRAQPPEPPVDR